MNLLSRICLFVVLLSVAVVLPAQSPPKNLHKVDDHWTAWQPPTEFPEGAEVYTIERGDTLWDLAERFFGDPYLWPQIWERNQYILDAHWIYPGDPLLMGIRVEAPTTETFDVTDDGMGDGDDDDHGVRATNDPFVQLATADDIYCSGYVGEMEEEFPYAIVGSEYEILGPSFDLDREILQARFGTVDTVKYGLSIGDIVYLSHGTSSGLNPGDVLTVIQPQDVVKSPHGGDRIGRFYAYEGRVRVLSLQEETGIGEIVQGCDPIVIGDRMRLFTPEPVPSERKRPLRPVSDALDVERLADAATIVRSKDRIVSLGKDHVVFLDQGENDDLVPGDVLTIFRPHRPGLPPLLVGEVAVISVRPTTSVAKIVESRHPVYVGDYALIP